MAASIQINVANEIAKADVELRAKLEAVRGERLNKQIGRGVSNLFRDHLLSMDAKRANKMGGKRSHFYGDAAKATSSVGDAEGATVTIGQLGFRQRLEGGEIKPGAGKKYLTIPARAEAYGRRAREFANLRFVKLSGGRGMLVADESREKVQGSKKKFVVKREDGLVYYWLVPFVLQQADRSILPSNDAIAENVRQTVRAAFQRNAQGGAAK